MTQKSVPQRMCIVCREMRDKKELLRIVQSPDGEISVDQTGKKNGRGAYICNSPECISKAIRTKALNRAFKRNITAVQYQSILEDINAGVTR